MNTIATELKWGVIFVLMSLFWMVLEKVIGLHGPYIDKHPIVTNFIAIPAIAIYVFALLDKKNDDYAGKMTYRQGFVSGAIITLVVAVLSPASQWITSKVISPEYFPNVITYVVSHGQMSQTDAEAYFNLKNYMIQSVVGAIIMGLLTTAIVAFFTKSKS
ncbi:DUF4199 domain-containing protein [Flectobacillus major]|jgi:hypothetical protein|uniref:DUF4199 domain-containing protein n=1 Tax=Flectobacillus major TaxID=103 RepID=UPI000423D93A|nr:DUF4199 domain-containing protein [Flectobacillus major]